jgi:crotonobetainyl-CoA:carnitine CoA-transferase CaiB-like acyl-CoA transferase
MTVVTIRSAMTCETAAWVAANDHGAILSACSDAGAPASLIDSVADIFPDPQYRARQNIKMAGSRIGELAVPEVVSRLSATSGKIEWLGAGLGEHQPCSANCSEWMRLNSPLRDGSVISCPDSKSSQNGAAHFGTN